MSASFPSLPAVLTMSLLLFSAPAQAKDACAKHLKMTCTGCHTLEAPCEMLGRPAKEWKSLLSRMRINGAELSSGDIEALSVCLSEPSAAAKAACGK